MLVPISPESPRRLELFCLVLVMVNRGNRAVPLPLAVHFNCVLTQAKALASDPRQLSPQTIPQAVQLANEMRCFGELRDTFLQVASLEDVSPEVAHRALQNMRSSRATTD